MIRITTRKIAAFLRIEYSFEKWIAKFELAQIICLLLLDSAVMLKHTIMKIKQIHYIENFVSCFIPAIESLQGDYLSEFLHMDVSIWIHMDSIAYGFFYNEEIEAYSLTLSYMNNDV